MCRGVWSILKPASHSCYRRCICLVSISHTEDYWIPSPNSGKPQDDIKAGESCYRQERVCTYTNTHTLYPYLCGEIKATQAVRNHRMVELIKKAAGDRGYKENGIQRRTRGELDNREKTRQYSLMTQNKSRPLRPWCMHNKICLWRGVR